MRDVHELFTRKVPNYLFQALQVQLVGAPLADHGHAEKIDLVAVRGRHGFLPEVPVLVSDDVVAVGHGEVIGGEEGQARGLPCAVAQEPGDELLSERGRVEAVGAAPGMHLFTHRVYAQGHGPVVEQAQPPRFHHVAEVAHVGPEVVAQKQVLHAGARACVSV